MSNFLYSVKYFFILDNKGNRIIAKYYSNDFENVNKQKAFEKRIFEKTAKAYSNVIIYVVGDRDQNELALLHVINSFTETLHSLSENGINKKTILDNINLTLLTLDEIIDEGIVLESDPTVIADRVGIRVEGEQDDLDQSISQVITSANNFLKYLNK
ncbi:longin domain-containing protein [Heterostelium album PN500]|uniref:Longin domain-containing protein n=1 Tax=Heterostelium pallidum (strain ATCC 26659 / Pp 5 / PN500) TaxID=670386 RepID=D3BR31_HETP5|nr:longin domain-containing protein [Heterostelium album PN500]EFA75863.1 longin domain-containing protein [Heterostelium album PN500]|eukprot:XP_020427997.1 longin domain-containing protein [Heterostelium album PN500]